MRKADAFTLFVASSIALTAAAGCNCSGKDAKQAAPVVEVKVPPPSPLSDAKVQVQEAKKERKEAPIIPTVTDRKMALQLGYQLMAQGQVEEAEAKFKIAAAGGSSEAETMLLKIRMEKESKRLMDSAKEKIEFGDYDGAMLVLGSISSDSVQKAKADQLVEEIQRKKAARDQKIEENLRKGMEKAFTAPDEGEEAEEGAEEAEPSAEEEAAPAAEPPADSPEKAAPQAEEEAPAADAPAAEEPAAEPAAE